MPTEHSISSNSAEDLELRLAAAEKKLSEMELRLATLEGIGREIKPRGDANLDRLSERYEAQVIDTGGDWKTIPEAVAAEGSGPIIVHHPKKHGLQTYAYANLQQETPLHIIFHGAMVGGTWFPRFERVTSMNEAGRSFCSIADPTIQLDRSLKLGWYGGNDAIDPIDWVTSLVTRLVEITKTSQLIFVGSSGGGFAALQASRRFTDSLAFVMDPQTIITEYHEAQVNRFLEAGFDGMSATSALAAYPDRLSAVASYEQSETRNFIYYTQHLWDKFHVEHHLGPFALSRGVDVPTQDADIADFRLRVVQRGRHGPLPLKVFDRHLELATDWHAAALT